MDSLHTTALILIIDPQSLSIDHNYHKKSDIENNDEFIDEKTQSSLKSKISAFGVVVIGILLVLLQIVFLWSLIDNFSKEYILQKTTHEVKSTKYTIAMSYDAFGNGRLNDTIMIWDSLRSSSNKNFCRYLVENCGVKWSFGEPCLDYNSITMYCPPWDIETHLLGMRGNETFQYVSIDGGHTISGGKPYYESMTRGVIINWALGMDPGQMLYKTLVYRYAISDGNAHICELICLVSFTLCFMLVHYASELRDHCYQFGIYIKLSLIDSPHRTLFTSCARILFSDAYVSLRMIAIASIASVAAMLFSNSRGVQEVFGASIQLTFLCSIDNLIFKQLQVNTAFNKSPLFTQGIEPLVTDFIEFKSKSSISIPLFCGHNLRLSDSTCLLISWSSMSVVLWLISVSIAVRCSINLENAAAYYNSTAAFSTLGGGVFAVHFFSVLSAAPSLTRDGGYALILRITLNLISVYFITYLIVFNGLLFWSSDVVISRRCDFSHHICETLPEIIWRELLFVIFPTATDPHLHSGDAMEKAVKRNMAWVLYCCAFMYSLIVLHKVFSNAFSLSQSGLKGRRVVCVSPIPNEEVEVEMNNGGMEHSNIKSV
jgi:hypothetical protein